MIQPLRRKKDNLCPPARELIQGVGALGGGHQAVEVDAGDALLLQVAHLVVHEGNQRRNDDGQPAHHHRRKLPAEALARAGGQEAQQIPPIKQGVSRLLLTGAKAADAESFAKNFAALLFSGGAHQKLRPPPPWVEPLDETCVPLP